MIRAIRPSAMAQDDAALISGWNIAPNIAYTIRLLPGASSCGVLLYADDASALIASGAALTGTEQPCVLIPQSGQTVEMVDADLGWHLLLTTTGTESQRTIRIGPAVDLPDEIHPIYGGDGLALARATAAIDHAAHYIDDVTVTCPLGIGAGIGDVVSVPVDGAAVVGQVESITWTATPDGTPEQAVIRRHVAIAPEPYVEPLPAVPPVVVDDTGATDAATTTSGNVLTNDGHGLTVVAVNGLSGNVGVAVDGSDGGVFTIAADGTWAFDPDGDFAALTGSETAETSVTYYASDGVAEAMATLTVTVSATSVITGYRFFRLLISAVSGSANRAVINGFRVVDSADNVHPSVAMTANNAPSPLIAQASSERSGFPAYNAFNDVSSSWQAAVADGTGWVKIDLGEGNEVNAVAAEIYRGSYTLSFRYNPTAFSIEGSNSGAFSGEQDVLYTVSGLTTGWSDAWRYFNF